MVVDIYRHLLNRGPDPEGQRNAVNLVSRRGVQPLIDQIVDSQSTASSSAIGPFRDRASGSARTVSGRISRAAPSW
jgi:hypothetical protein